MSAPDDLPRLPPLETAEEHVLPLRQVLEARALLLTRQHPGNELIVTLMIRQVFPNQTALRLI